MEYLCMFFWRFYLSVILLHLTVNSHVLNPDRIQYVPPITFLSKRPAALNTAETLRVPVLVQSGDHFLNNKRNKTLNGVIWVEVLIWAVRGKISWKWDRDVCMQVSHI